LLALWRARYGRKRHLLGDVGRVVCGLATPSILGYQVIRAYY